MGYIPKNTKWYLADLVIEHRIANERRRVIHINTVLVRANSPKSAYLKSMILGRKSQYTYKNTEDNNVKVIFRGLRELMVIHEELEHGAELYYSEKVVSTEKQISGMLTKKHKLSVFLTRIKPSKSILNYMPKSIYQELLKAGFSDKDIYKATA